MFAILIPFRLIFYWQQCSNRPSRNPAAVHREAVDPAGGGKQTPRHPLYAECGSGSRGQLVVLWQAAPIGRTL